jgi:hypothetical protein
MKRIDVLPDDVLLEIFDFYVDKRPSYLNKTRVEAWQSLVHVCQRWRNLVLGSPCRLNLRLCCTRVTPMDTLDIWPALPLIIDSIMTSTSDTGTDNIIAALGQSSRICQVNLMDSKSPHMEQILTAMQVPFPELTDLQIWAHDTTPPVIPVSFLGGSAPRLRSFTSYGIPFPGLPDLLLSATHLVKLNLYGIPPSGYISPEAIVALFSMLSSLETLSLDFRSPQSRPPSESRSLLPLNRSILPALHEFRFKGIAEYLEDLVTRIHTPQLDKMDLTFFDQIDFHCPQLTQFINCSPTLRAPDEAHVQFEDLHATVTLLAQSRALKIKLLCRKPDRQLSFVAQVCKPSFPPLSTVEDLYIECQLNRSRQVWNNDAIENTVTRWLPLLLPFTAVKNLYLCKEFGPSIAAALQDPVGGRTIEVFPGLQNIFVEELGPSGPFQNAIEQFVASRQLSGRPVAMSVGISVVWDLGQTLT